MPGHQIRDRIIELVARHSGIPREKIDPAVSVWDNFPRPGRIAHPTAAAFETDLLREYPVYLAEAEFENPTVDELAGIIAAKLADPSRSERDRTVERAALWKGMLWSWAFTNALLAGVFVLAKLDSWSPRRYTWLLAVAAVLNACWAYALLRQRSSR